MLNKELITIKQPLARDPGVVCMVAIWRERGLVGLIKSGTWACADTYAGAPKAYHYGRWPRKKSATPMRRPLGATSSSTASQVSPRQAMVYGDGSVAV